MAGTLASRYCHVEFDPEEAVTEVQGRPHDRRRPRGPSVPEPMLLGGATDLVRWASRDPDTLGRLREFAADYAGFCALAPLLVSACTRVVTLQMISGIAPDRPDLHATTFLALRRAASASPAVQGQIAGLVGCDARQLAGLLVDQLGRPGGRPRDLADLLAVRRRAHADAGVAADAATGWCTDPAGRIFEVPIERLLTMLGSLRERLAVALAIEARLATSGALGEGRALYERAEAWIGEAGGFHDGSVDKLFQAVTWVMVYRRSLADLPAWKQDQIGWLAPLRELARLA